MADRLANTDGPAVAARELEGRECCGSLAVLVRGWEAAQQTPEGREPQPRFKAPDTLPILATRFLVFPVSAVTISSRLKPCLRYKVFREHQTRSLPVRSSQFGKRYSPQFTHQ